MMKAYKVKDKVEKLEGKELVGPSLKMRIKKNRIHFKKWKETLEGLFQIKIKLKWIKFRKNFKTLLLIARLK